MKINLNTKIVDIYGNPVYVKTLDEVVNNTLQEFRRKESNSLTDFILEVNQSRGEELTLKKVLVNCLLAKAQGEEVDADESLRRYLVATGIQGSNSYNLDEKDRAILVKALPKYYGIEVVGQVMNLLNGDKVKEDEAA